MDGVRAMSRTSFNLVIMLGKITILFSLDRKMVRERNHGAYE